jgi:hypothetical protein
LLAVTPLVLAVVADLKLGGGGDTVPAVAVLVAELVVLAVVALWWRWSAWSRCGGGAVVVVELAVVAVADRVRSMQDPGGDTAPHRTEFRVRAVGLKPGK